MSPHGKGEGTGDAPAIEVVRFRSFLGTIGEIGLRRVFVDAVELGDVTLVASIMRETLENYRRDRLTARDARNGVLNAITEL